ncbi:hypothetical protein LguiA_021008 [Lonicera macranthoides]
MLQIPTPSPVLEPSLGALVPTPFSRPLQWNPKVLNERGPDPSPQFERSGLDPYIKQSLPTMQYKKQKNDGEDSESDISDCAVCLSTEEGGWIKRLPNCHHFFHLGCIDTFFQSNLHAALTLSSKVTRTALSVDHTHLISNI